LEHIEVLFAGVARKRGPAFSLPSTGQIDCFEKCRSCRGLAGTIQHLFKRPHGYPQQSSDFHDRNLAPDGRGIAAVPRESEVPFSGFRH
jgi:hypothetical protein